MKIRKRRENTRSRCFRERCRTLGRGGKKKERESKERAVHRLTRLTSVTQYTDTHTHKHLHTPSLTSSHTTERAGSLESLSLKLYVFSLSSLFSLLSYNVFGTFFVVVVVALSRFLFSPIILVFLAKNRSAYIACVRVGAWEGKKENTKAQNLQQHRLASSLLFFRVVIKKSK